MNIIYIHYFKVIFFYLSMLDLWRSAVLRQTPQPPYLYNLISVQPHRSTRSLDVVTLFRPPSSSSLKVNHHSYHHALLCLWNQLPKELRLPTDHKDLSLSFDLTCQFVISFTTTVTIHYSSLPLQAQNSSFLQILSSIVLPLL